MQKTLLSQVVVVSQVAVDDCIYLQLHNSAPESKSLCRDSNQLFTRNADT